MIENSLAAFDLSGVLSALEESVTNNKEIQYAILVDAEGVVFADTHRPELTQTKLTGEYDLKALKSRSVTAFRYNDGQVPVIEITNWCKSASVRQSCGTQAMLPPQGAAVNRKRGPGATCPAVAGHAAELFL